MARNETGSFNGPGVVRILSPTVIGLVDQNGRALERDAPYRAPTDPLRDVDVGQTIGNVHRDLAIITTVTGWTVEAVRNALEGHTQGMFYESAKLVDAMLGDDRVQATLGSRTGAVFGEPITMTPADESSEAGGVLDAWRKAWPKLAPQSVLADMKRWAIMEGFAIAEVLWDTSVTPWQPYLKPWHPQNIYYDWQARQYVVSTQDGPLHIEPGSGRWFLHAPHGPYRGWQQAAVRACALPWLGRNFSYRDWLRYSERHGLPMLLAEVPAMGDAVLKRKFVEALPGIGQETCVLLPQNADGTGYKLNMLEARDRSWESFKGLIDRCDMSIVLTIKFQNLTTQVEGGSFAAARQHAQGELIAAQFDNETLSADIDDQLARPYAAFNFGNPDLAPHTRWDVEPLEDEKANVDVLEGFARAVGSLRTAGVVFDLGKLATAYRVDLPAGATLASLSTGDGGAAAASPGDAFDKFSKSVDQMRAAGIELSPDALARLAETMGLPLQASDLQRPPKESQVYKYHLDYGALALNEIRARLGLPPMEGGDVAPKPLVSAGGFGGDQ